MQDVIVIGAGFTGLSAAVALMDRGRDVLLLEARDRVGGRVESVTLDGGQRIDTGGQFICEDMPEVMALAQAYGKTLVETDETGDITFQPRIPPGQGYAIYGEVDELRTKAVEADISDPALAGISVSQWLDRQDATEQARNGFRAMINGLWCRSPDEIPFLYYALSDRRITNTISESQYSLGETMHALAEDLARKLGPRLVLNSAVTEIHHSDTEVEVICGARRFVAGQVIVAVPPVMARRLAYQPPLPEPLTKALAVWGTGAVFKILVRFERPFWRERGLSGIVMWSQPQGLYACDVSRPDMAALVMFIGGPEALHWHSRPESELRAFIAAQLQQALGAEAASIKGMEIRDWVDDTWSGGGYSDAVIDLLADDPEPVLLSGLPRLQFACTELSPSYPGYIEGAIVAGRIAADRILKAS